MTEFEQQIFDVLSQVLDEGPIKAGGLVPLAIRIAAAINAACVATMEWHTYHERGRPIPLRSINEIVFAALRGEP